MAKNKKITIVGFGQEGLSAANFFANNFEISIFDDKPKQAIEPISFKKLKATSVNFYLGRNLKKIKKADMVVRSPGVRPDHPLIQKLVAGGAVFTSPTKIFFEQSPAQIIGVTGTKGKGTTSSLIYEILKAEGKDAYL